MKKFLRNFWWDFDLGLMLRWIGVFVVSAVLPLLYIVYISRYETVSLTNLLMPIAGLLGIFVLMAFRPNLRKMLLVVIIFDIVIQIDKYFNWEDEFGYLGTLAGFNVSLTTLAILMLYSYWIIELLIEEDVSPYRPRFSVGYPHLLYMGTMALSLLAAVRPDFVYYQIWLHMQMFFLFSYIVGTFRSKEDFLLILMSFAVLVTFEATYMSWQRVTGGAGGYVEGISVYAYRVSGHFGGPNAAGAFFSLTIVLLLPLALMQAKKIYNIMGIIGIIFGVIGVFLALSRGAWGASIISLIIFISLMVYRGWISISLPIMVVLLIIAIIFLFPDLVLNRIFGDDGGSADGRVPLNNLAMNMIDDHFIIGVGANNFAAVAPDYLGPEFSRIWFYTVHNQYLLVWSETGIIGFSAFIFFLLNIVWRGIWVWLQKNKFTSMIGLSCLSAIVGHAFHFQADIFNSRPSVQMLWILASLITALFLWHREDSSNIPLEHQADGRKNSLTEVRNA